MSTPRFLIKGIEKLKEKLYTRFLHSHQALYQPYATLLCTGPLALNLLKITVALTFQNN
jgi:hypothetical protein